MVENETETEGGEYIKADAGENCGSKCGVDDAVRLPSKVVESGFNTEDAEVVG